MAANNERDAGFCSGGDEDDMSGLHSPSASEDSVEVQVTPISLRNKRKLAEPRKIQEPNPAPLKKRRFQQIDRASTTTSPKTNTTITRDNVVQDEESRSANSPSPSPFRPWSSPVKTKSLVKNSTSTEVKETSTRERPEESDSQEGSVKSLKEEILRRHNESRWIEEENKRREEESRRRYEARIQEEVLTRLQESEQRRHQQQQQQQRPRPLTTVSPQLLQVLSPSLSSSGRSSANSKSSRRERRQERFEELPPPPTQAVLQEEPLSLVLRGENSRVPSHPAVDGSYDRLAIPSTSSSSSSYAPEHNLANSSLRRPESRRTSESIHPDDDDNDAGDGHEGQQSGQRNYKNMTRERRIEANARERTRVHTISAAFETLRKAIPAYSHNQKLSKLSVLRIACSYIMALSNIVNTPEGDSISTDTLGSLVDLVSRTIQTEGKLRKKKDE